VKITIETKPIKQIKNSQAGDWIWLDNGDLEITMPYELEWRERILVGIHELIEAVLCQHDGVSEKDVDEFDAIYESQRIKGDNSEAGDSILAPYRKQHLLSTGVEKILAAELNVDWNRYESNLDRNLRL
jgi:hypothetical protein